MLKKKSTEAKVDLMPKVDAVPVHTNTFFGIQILRTDRSYRELAKLVCELAAQEGFLFRKLQVLDVTPVGSTSLVRFRTDLQDVEAILGLITGRAVAFSDPNGVYQVKFPNGKIGKLASAIMCTPAQPGFGDWYVGPKIKDWETQF